MAYKKTRVATITFADNGITDVRLAEKVDVLDALEFEFSGTLTVAGGATDGALNEDGLLETVLKEIQLTADGKDQHILTDGVGEYFRRAILSGSPGVLVNPAVGVGANACRFHARLDLGQSDSAAKFAGRINAIALDTLNLRITHGDGSNTGAASDDLMSGGDRDEALTGTLDVFAGWHDSADEWLGGARFVEKRPVSVSSALSEFGIDLPPNRLISGILLHVIDNGVRDNDLLTAVKVRLRNREDYRDLTFEEIQSANVEDYGLELSSGAPPYTGLAFIDFDADKDMSPKKILSTFGLGSEGAELLITTGSPTGVAVVTPYIISVDPSGVGARRPRPTPAAVNKARQFTALTT